MKNNLKTLVFGASTKPYRYAHRAVKILRLNGHDVVALGLRKGKIEDVEIVTGTPKLDDIHTITMYVNANRQKEFYTYLLALNPKRIIFNPGAENSELYDLASKEGIQVENACTLVLLSIGEYDKVHT